MTSNFGRFPNDPTSQRDLPGSAPAMSSPGRVGDVVGVIPLIGMYIWSVVSRYTEAERQNKAHGL